MAARRLSSSIVCVLVLLLAACSPGEEEGQQSPTPSPSPTATDPGEETPDAGEETPAAEEDTAVAVLEDGRVVVLDAATGEELREVHAGVRVDDPAANGVAVTPDGETAFVTLPSAPDESGAASQLVRLSLDDGEEDVVTEATRAAVSPDGAELAYVTYEDDPLQPEPVLVLRDLASGEERSLVREQPFQFIADIDWTGDGTTVVFTAGEIHLGLYAVDQEAASLDDARRLGPDLEVKDRNTSWSPVAAFGEDGLAVAESCCDLPREHWEIIEVSATDGSEEGPLIEEGIQATHLDSDADAERLLIVDRDGQLLRWDGDGPPEEIAEGVVVAGW